MTNVEFFIDNDNKIYSFKVTGHVDFALDGDDALCAAISTLVSHTIGQVHEFTDDPCENIVDEDIPMVVFKLHPPSGLPPAGGDLSYIFMESLASSVDDLAMMHPDYIKVSYTES